MNRKITYKTLLIILILVFTLSETPSALPLEVVGNAQAAPVGLNLIPSFLRTLGALNTRNRIYREAGITAKEVNDYYDSLIERTITTREEYIHKAVKGETSPKLAAAYVRIQEALEWERDVAIQMIESEKKGARQDFKATLRQEVLKVLIASPGAQKLLKDIRETIDGLRKAATTIRDALANNKPTDMLVRQFSDRYAYNPFLKSATHYLGSKVAKGLDRRVGGVLSFLDKTSQLVKSEMDDALGKIEELDQHVANLQDQPCAPVSLLEIGGELGGFRALDRSGAGADAVADAYVKKASQMGAIQGTDEELESMRVWIRRTLLEIRVDYLQEGFKSAAKYVDCQSTDRDEYLKARQELGLAPEEPLNPDQARYLVCYYSGTESQPVGGLFNFGPEKEVAFAALIGLSKEQAAEMETPPEAAGESPVESSGESQVDAASCDALEFISVEVVGGPEEETRDDGSYSCYISYSITNTHETSTVVLSWKQTHYPSSRGSYWTHPKLGPGESYDPPLSLNSHMASNGNWNWSDSDYLMAWLATEECDRYKNQFWPTEEEPDRMLTSGFNYMELESPCRR